MSKEFSEEEDDPAVYESSGSEWNSSSEIETKRKRGRPARTPKKARTKRETSTEDSESDEPKKRRKNGGATPKKAQSDTGNNSEESKASEENSKSATPSKNYNLKEYSTGSFLILKKDAQNGDKSKQPCIWRVDGKALLQKYIPFDDNGVTRHKTTSTYTGWSPLESDLYAPVSVTIKNQKDLTLVVDLNWEKLKEIDVDSE